jgi:hypothetical protein
VISSWAGGDLLVQVSLKYGGEKDRGKRDNGERVSGETAFCLTRETFPVSKIVEEKVKPWEVKKVK